VSTEPENLQELAAAYALGALEPAEARAFEKLLATSPEAQREVAEYREVGALLALSSASAAPASDLRQRVIARAAAQKDARITPRGTASSRTAWIALAAALVAVVGLALAWQGLRKQVNQQQATITALQDTLSRTSASLNRRVKQLDEILDPNVSLIRMGTPGTPQPVVQLFWNRQRHQITAHAFQLVPAASKRTYQLWFIPKNGKPIPSVTFNSEASGHALVESIEVPADVELAAAAITEEPEGGSPQPTTTPFLVGTLVAEKT
jgi:anti-sigma-K factor RskA